MADEVLDFLKERFNRVDTAISLLRADMRDLTQRVGRIEREMANLHSDFADMSGRLDHISDRLDRIERRLDLVEG